MGIEERKRGLARFLWILLACSLAGARAGAALAQAEIVGLDGWPRPLAAAASPFGVLGRLPDVGGYAAKWREMARAVDREAGILARCRVEPETCPEPAQQLLRIIEAARAQEGRARLGVANRAINLAIRYQSDMAHHGAPDVWSSPLATLSSGRGDCEDFALIKYLALHEAGIPVEDMRFVIVRDTKLDQVHAVLTVRFDDRWLVLDNRRLVLLEDHDAPNYTALSVFGSEGGTPLSAQVREIGASEGSEPAASSVERAKSPS